MHRDESINHKLALTMQGLIYHCAACMICSILIPQKLPWELFLAALYIPLFSFSAVRNRCNNFILFLLIHIAISGIYLLFISDTLSRIVIGGCMLIMSVSSFRLRLKPVYARYESCPPIAFAGLFLFVYIMAQANGISQMMQISYYEIFIYLILFSTYKCLNNTTGFLKSNQDIDMCPSKQIKFLNKIILCIFLFFLLIGMIGAQHLPIENIFSEIGSFLLIILRGILRFIFQLFGSGDIMTEEPAPEVNISPPLIDSGEVSPFIQFLEQLLKTVFFLLLAFFVVKMFAKLLYELYKRFYEQQKADTDESEFIWKNKSTIKEKIKKIYNKRETAARNEDEKIRKIYKKYIRHQFGRKTTIPSSKTPAELEAFIASQKDSADPLIHILTTPDAVKRLNLYEKARYSQHKCEKQDVEQMKQLSKNK